MGFSKKRFCLDFSMPLREQDWRNFNASGVSLVMLPLPFCDQTTLVRLAAAQCKVVIRVPEDTYYDDFAPHRILLQVEAASHACPVEAVIVGVEPDGEFVLSRGEPTWGQDHAYEHRAQFDAVRRSLQGAGFRVVSPGYKNAVRFPDGHVARSISEDDPPAPGMVTWREICCLPDDRKEFGYLAANGNGAHVYCYSHAGVVDDVRFKLTVQKYQEFYHQPMWIDEIGISSAGSQVERMRGYMALADQLLAHPSIGDAVEMFSPFVSNGVPDGKWDEAYLLDDPAAYVELGRWLAA